MSLVTRCPKCQSGFEVAADQLRLHDGLVRCGQCALVFDGYAHLQAALPTLTRKVDTIATPTPEPVLMTDPNRVESVRSSDTVQAAPRPVPVSAPPVPASPVPNWGVQDRGDTLESDALPSQTLSDTPSNAQAAYPRVTPSIRVQAPAATPRAAVPEDSIEPVLSIRPTPRFNWRASDIEDDSAQDEAPVRVMGEARVRDDDPAFSSRYASDELTSTGWRIPGFVWGVLALVLLAVMVLQVTIYYRHDIATAVPMTRPLLQQLCERVGCEVNYPRRPDRIVIIGSSLQQAEQSAAQQAANTMPYVLKLTLQNRNDIPQPWPSLLLTLNDASSTVVIRKVLAPSQYLPPALQNQPFAPRQELALELPLVVQGHVVSGFEVRRFFP